MPIRHLYQPAGSSIAA